MNKYNVYLADNWGRTDPFTTEWDYELLGDKLRAEFDEYFAEQEKNANAGAGKSKQLLKGEFIKRFMILKRINLVDNPATGNLKSVFILKLTEKKLIDQRAKNTLAVKFEYKVKTRADGAKSVPEGFLKFDLVEGVENKDIKTRETLQVSGNDIEYFNEESQEEPSATEVVEVPKKEEVEVFACKKCGKEFASKRALHGHNLTCKE